MLPEQDEEQFEAPVSKDKHKASLIFVGLGHLLAWLSMSGAAALAISDDAGIAFYGKGPAGYAGGTI